MTPSNASATMARRIVECIVVTLAIPTIGYAIDRSDPFFLRYRFPWLVLAPLLVALRHGFTLGFGSACALGVALIMAWRTRLVPMTGFPGEPAVGLVALAMIAGQFAELWKREILRRDSRFAILREQADRLARSHLLLEASHDRLDEQMQRKTGSLRQAMAALTALGSEKERISLATHAAAVMDVFTVHCGLEIGELFAVDRGILGERYAAIGRTEPMRRDDPLLVQAVRSGRLTYIPAATVPGRDRSLSHSPLLAAVPFVDSSGAVHAVLCVQAMPFLSFDKHNLDTMVMVAASVAERLCELPRSREMPATRIAEGARA
jgi:hypothetical protein